LLFFLNWCIHVDTEDEIKEVESEARVPRERDFRPVIRQQPSEEIVNSEN